MDVFDLVSMVITARVLCGIMGNRCSFSSFYMFPNLNDTMFVVCRRKRRLKHKRYASSAVNSGLYKKWYI